MRNPLTIAVAQPRCHPHDVEANAAEHARIVEEVGARVVVFPELSLTGYHFDADPVAAGDPRLSSLVAACGDHDTIALVGGPVSVSVSTEGERSIGMFAVDGTGASVVYRKMYLGSAEEAVFTAGTDPAVLDVDGWRLGLAICKDTGVPAHADATAALGIDVYVAGVLETLDDADVQPRRAQAIVDRHRVWVAVASFAGATGEGFDQAAGGSTIWAPDGRIAATAGIDEGPWAATVIGNGG